MKTQYAFNQGTSLAFQVIGDGPFDLLLTTGWVVSMDSLWEDPAYTRFVERLATFSRVIMWDKRGTGLSDRVGPKDIPSLDERVEDMTAVLDAAGAREPALFGLSEGSPMSVRFAAAHPERVSKLVLYGGWGSSYPVGDSPGLMEADLAEEFIDGIRQSWGDTGGLLQLWAPSVADDERAQDWWNRALSAGASPTAALAWLQMTAALDVRAALPCVSAPTLVVHRLDDLVVPVENGRYVAGQIPDARFVALPGQDHLWWIGDQDALLDEVEGFLTGSLADRDHHRALMTVLFVDVVGSTQRMAELGDRGWRDVSAAHDRDVRRQLGRFGGREVKTLGDGVLATFDSPARAIRCACAIRDGSRDLGMPVRAGLHTGECELVGDDISGMAVNIGARVGALAESDEVLVSSTVRDLVVGSDIEFTDRGTHTLKGVPGEWRVLAVDLDASRARDRGCMRPHAKGVLWRKPPPPAGGWRSGAARSANTTRRSRRRRGRRR